MLRFFLLTTFVIISSLFRVDYEAFLNPIVATLVVIILIIGYRLKRRKNKKTNVNHGDGTRIGWIEGLGELETMANWEIRQLRLLELERIERIRENGYLPDDCPGLWQNIHEQPMDMDSLCPICGLRGATGFKLSCVHVVCHDCLHKLQKWECPACGSSFKKVFYGYLRARRLNKIRGCEPHSTLGEVGPKYVVQGDGTVTWTGLKSSGSDQEP